MSDLGGLQEDEPDSVLDQEPAHPRERRTRRGCLPALVVLLVVAALVVVAGAYGYEKVKGAFASAPDFPGPGSGQVSFQVKQGDTTTVIGRNLKKIGVVKSVDAFTAAARDDSAAQSIQVGYYDLQKQMKASEALDVLTDPKNLMQARVTIPEGYRVTDIVAAIAKGSDITAQQVRQALAKPQELGLPPEAGGNPEGYLFPATYSITPKETATDLLRQMVAKTLQVEKSLDVATKAQAHGLTPQQVLTVASMLEYEGSRDQDYPKIAQAIYNRIKAGMPIQSDATVAFANNLKGTVYTTAQQRANPSPYNTYVHPGLPPGPIGSAGEKTIEAALDPTPGPWLYWVVVNLRTGETRFNTTFAGHNRDVAELHRYCQTSTAC